MFKSQKESISFRPITRSSSIPLYVQVRDVLLEEIESGHLPEGTLLPSEPELCKLFDISRSSLRQAIQELANQGLLKRSRGKGTFIASCSPKMSLPLMRGLTEAMQAIGANVTSIVQKNAIEEATEEVAKNLQCPQGTQVLHIDRLRLVNDLPLRFDELYIIYRLCPGLENMDLNQSLRELLRRKFHLRVSGGIYKIKAILANEHQANSLLVQVGDPLLLAEGLDRDQHGYPFIDTTSIYRCDRYEFIAETNS